MLAIDTRYSARQKAGFLPGREGGKEMRVKLCEGLFKSKKERDCTSVRGSKLTVKDEQLPRGAKPLDGRLHAVDRSPLRPSRFLAMPPISVQSPTWAGTRAAFEPHTRTGHRISNRNRKKTSKTTLVSQFKAFSGTGGGHRFVAVKPVYRIFFFSNLHY